MFFNHASYRKVKPLCEIMDDDALEGQSMSWMAFWPKSAQLLFELTESAVFQHNQTDEVIIRMGLKNGKTGEEIIQDLC